MNDNNKKDYYISVLTAQIILCALLTTALCFFSGTDSILKEEFLVMINRNLTGIEIDSAIETFRKQLYTGEIFTVLNIKDDFAEETTEAEGVGGKDIEFYEAAKNTSFSPVFSTAKIVSPVENGRYTSFFGYRINPITGDYGFHTGLDIAAPEGTNIRAAFSGTVTKKGFDEQAGNYIYLTHDDGFVTFYCHCSEILAEENAVIRQGETIALIGSTGWSTGPHLHFEIRKDNIRYNPLWLLDDGI